MSDDDGAACCFKDCDLGGEATLRLEVYPPPDGGPVVIRAHQSCFERARDPSVEPDDPADYGRIPAKARCAFCGASLPIVGSHPFVFDVADAAAQRRFWTHAECMRERCSPSVVRHLQARERSAW